MNCHEAFDAVLDRVIAGHEEAGRHMAAAATAQRATEAVERRHRSHLNLARKAREVLGRCSFMGGGGDPALDANKVEQALAFLEGIET